MSSTPENDSNPRATPILAAPAPTRATPRGIRTRSTTPNEAMMRKSISLAEQLSNGGGNPSIAGSTVFQKSSGMLKLQTASNSKYSPRSYVYA